MAEFSQVILISLESASGRLQPKWAVPHSAAFIAGKVSKLLWPRPALAHRQPQSQDI